MLQNDQDPHEWVRKDAEWVLGEIEEGVIDAVSTLIQALQDQESHVRASTTQVLDSIGKDAVPILIELLQDQDSEVSYYVALAFMTKSKILTEPSAFTSPMIPAPVYEMSRLKLLPNRKYLLCRHCWHLLLAWPLTCHLAIFGVASGLMTLGSCPSPHRRSVI